MKTMLPEADRGSFAIRDYRKEDEGGVLSLLRTTLGEGRSFVRSLAFWQWKHFENPFGTSQLLLAANEEIVGLRAFMRWRFRSPAGDLRAVRAVDTSTHPGYRRMGVFSTLTRSSLERARADGVDLIFNTPNAQSMAGYLKLGWQWVGRPRLLVRVLNPTAIATVLLRRRARPGTVEPAGFFRASLRPVETLFAHADRLEQIVTFDDGLRARGIRTARSVDYLRWRYQPPSLRYFALWTGERPVTGVVILRPNVRNGLREIMMCEVLMGYGSAKHAREMVDELIRMVDADYLVAAATVGTQHWGMLRRAGFIPLPRMGPNFVVFPLNTSADQPHPARLENWHLSLGDLEIF